METYKDLPQWVLLDERRRVEIFNDLGLLDQNELAVCTALTEYARKYQTSYLPLQGLYKFVYEYGLRNNLNALKNEGNIVALLKKCYLALHKRNYCTADRKEGNIVGLILTGPQDLNPDQVQSILQKIKKDFADMDADLALPFPSADFLPKNGISPNTLCVLPVNDLSDRRIRETQQKGIPLTKVTFQGTNPILIPTDELNRLRDRAFNKLKYTLSKSRDLNALIVMKLKKQFPKLANINQSEDFFRHERDNQFWAVLASEILNYVESNEKEKALAQSAELVKYTSILESEDEHKKTHDDKSLEIILNILASYPVAFTKGQILQLREKHSYLKLYTERDYIDIANAFIQKFTASQTADTPPVVIPLKFGGEFRYIYRDHFFKLFMEKIESLAYELRTYFTERLRENAADFLDNPVVQNPEIFAEYVNTYLYKHPDVVSMFENPPLLYTLLLFESRRDSSYGKLLDRFFLPVISQNDRPQLRPYSEILAIDRDTLLKEARIRVPLGQRIGIIRRIIEWFKSFGKTLGTAVDHQLEQKKHAPKFSDILPGGGPASESPQHRKSDKAAGSPAKTAEDKKKVRERFLAFKKELKIFQKELIGEKDLPEMMDYYNNRWNRTLSKSAQNENLQLVHTKIHHRLRYLNIPSVEKIKKETLDMIKTDDTLQKIYDMESLKNYILLYIIDYYMKKEEKN